VKGGGGLLFCGTTRRYVLEKGRGRQTEKDRDQAAQTEIKRRGERERVQQGISRDVASAVPKVSVAAKACLLPTPRPKVRQRIALAGTIVERWN
jgi:hypothetical protein